jgi:hypothetical protein
MTNRWFLNDSVFWALLFICMIEAKNAVSYLSLRPYYCTQFKVDLINPSAKCFAETKNRPCCQPIHLSEVT